jgi:hypothetical protein
MKTLKTILAAAVIIQIGYSQVSEQWSARYNFGSTDQCNAMKVDASGNVYLTGQAVQAGIYRRYCYSINIIQAELFYGQRFVGTGYGEDHGFAITSDASGNVYVTGRTWINTANNNDIITHKYNSLVIHCGLKI